MPHRSIPALTPDLLLRAYAAGIFPMAESADSAELFWFDPPVRGVIPLDDNFHLSRRLRRTIQQKPYDIRVNTCFRQIMQACAVPAPGRTTTWINQEIIDLYCALHEHGHAHSIEAWVGADLVGGLYGVSLGGAFFGESMFSRRDDASKISLVHLVALLRHSHFTLLDAQFQTDHLAQFGTYEISRTTYQQKLATAINLPVSIEIPLTSGALNWDYLLAGFLQPVTHKS